MGLCLFMISMCTRPNMFLSFSWKMSEFHWLCIVSCYYVEWNIWQTRHHLKAYIVVYFRFPSTHYFCLFFSVCHFTQTHIDVMQNFDSRDTINCIPNGRPQISLLPWTEFGLRVNLKHLHNEHFTILKCVIFQRQI